MPELASILEREGRKVDLEPGHYERLLRRRDRRRRNRRIGSTLLAVAIAAATISYAVNVIRDRRDQIPMDRITSRNVAHLSLAWTAAAQASAGTPGSPTVLDGIVYVDVGANGGTSGIQGFPLACRATGQTCEAVWSSLTSHELSGVVVDDERVYVGEGVTGSGHTAPQFTRYGVDAFARACSDRCRPVWTTRTAKGLDPIAVIGDRLYVRAGKRLEAYARSCGQPMCHPLWTATDVGPPTLVSGRAIVRTRRGVAMFMSACWTAHGPACPEVGSATIDVTSDPVSLPPPIVEDRRLLLDDETGIQAFPVECRGACRPEWQAKLPGGPGFQPVVTNGMVVAVTRDGSELAAFRIDCPTTRADGTCPPEWTAHPDGGIGFPPVVSGDRVTVGADLGSSLVAYPLSCVGECVPAWTAQLADSITFAPVVNEDVVMVSGVRGVTAFADGCVDRCPPLFHWDLPTGSPQISPIIDDDTVLVIGGDGLYALRLGADPEAIAQTPDRDGGFPVGVVALSVGGVIAIAAIRRRWSSSR
jgi:outer membrane protein assembly factor BamB